MCGCLLSVPHLGPGLQPRHVPWLAVEPVTLWFAGQCSVHWATAARRRGRSSGATYRRWKEFSYLGCKDQRLITLSGKGEFMVRLRRRKGDKNCSCLGWSGRCFKELGNTCVTWRHRRKGSAARSGLTEAHRGQGPTAAGARTLLPDQGPAAPIAPVAVSKWAHALPWFCLLVVSS